MTLLGHLYAASPMPIVDTLLCHLSVGLTLMAQCGCAQMYVGVALIPITTYVTALGIMAEE